MKVGILTKHSVPNYGAMLQAYALSTYLRGAGYDTELVDYDQPATTEYYRFKWRFPPLVNHWLRLKRAQRFVHTKQVRSDRHCTSIAEFQTFSGKYTHLITGSDQVWFTGPVQYYDPLYFLDFPFKGTKISYAPSAGGIDSFGEFSEKVRRALNDFGHISVRDANTFRLVSELTGRTPTVVSDPTILHDFKELAEPDRPPLREPYLLLFGRFSDAYQKLIAAAAAARGIKQIVSLQYANAIATKRVAAPSPEDWVRYFYHSAAVVTSYFHGTVFAIKFHKPFLSIPTEGRVKKVTAMLTDTALLHRLLPGNADSASFGQAWASTIDWQEVDGKVNERVRTSTNFLKSALV